ncbi:unnamed protein product [Gongylonema pulchrum]|uniref:Secreted protein n=1 Tax=Gongylonema pulchrum TaxID=637853 RepID=A0A183DBB8_9BILA|nr:unnamed protein product [Gongylonema pulchrum]
MYYYRSYPVTSTGAGQQRIRVARAVVADRNAAVDEPGLTHADPARHASAGSACGDAQVAAAAATVSRARQQQTRPAAGDYSGSVVNHSLQQSGDFSNSSSNTSNAEATQR